MNEIDNLYRATNMTNLSKMSTHLLEKYKNNRSKIVMIMNRYRKRIELLRKGKDIHKVYTYTPSNVNKLVNAGTITSKKNQSVGNYIRGKASFKNEIVNNAGFINKKYVAKRPFTIFGRKVKGYIPVPPSLDLEEAHKHAKFMQRLLNNTIEINFIALTEDQGGAIFF